MAMHVGMADLSVFPLRAQAWYAIASGAGMYPGHLIAWLAAFLQTALSRLVRSRRVAPSAASGG